MTNGDEVDLPEGWTETSLGRITSHPQYGWTCSSSDEGKIHLLRTTDISSGRINWSEVPFCELEPEDIDKYLVGENDLLVSRAGSVGVSIRIESVPSPAVFARVMGRNIRFLKSDLKPFRAQFKHEVENGKTA